MPDNRRAPRALALMDDTGLAALAAAGERAAFGELVRRHGSAVRWLLRRMGADAALADDLAQDAFLAAFEHVAAYRGEGGFDAWAKRIAARLYCKRRRREARTELMAEPPDPPAESGMQVEAEARLDLDAALRRLPAAMRLCVALCHGAGFSHAEAAALLDVPLGTVKSHVRRGLDRLKAHLAPTDPEETRR